MLVLTRKVDESIRIGDDIVITVSHLSGNRVRLAIDAPKDVRIVRSELFEHAAAERRDPSGLVQGASTMPEGLRLSARSKVATDVVT